MESNTEDRLESVRNATATLRDEIRREMHRKRMEAIALKTRNESKDENKTQLNSAKETNEESVTSQSEIKKNDETSSLRKPSSVDAGTQTVQNNEDEEEIQRVERKASSSQVIKTHRTESLTGKQSQSFRGNDIINESARSQKQNYNHDESITTLNQGERDKSLRRTHSAKTEESFKRSQSIRREASGTLRQRSQSLKAEQSQSMKSTNSSGQSNPPTKRSNSLFNLAALLGAKGKDLQDMKKKKEIYVSLGFKGRRRVREFRRLQKKHGLEHVEIELSNR
eukprot:c16133_g1_i1.p1 GENE.c16133_g1_i1~~c16133_g1_i1.p1  ORF type:complete len:281 (+),score=116.79 c16133_g1_i1:113-955(+)